jgi:hypothetical protein
MTERIEEIYKKGLEDLREKLWTPKKKYRNGRIKTPHSSTPSEGIPIVPFSNTESRFINRLFTT